MPPNGVPHLASPDSLPPGATMDPDANGADSPNVSYLKDLWQAVQSHDISGKEALIMGLSQRGMNTPYPQQGPRPERADRPGCPGRSGRAAATGARRTADPAARLAGQADPTHSSEPSAKILVLPHR